MFPASGQPWIGKLYLILRFDFESHSDLFNLVLQSSLCLIRLDYKEKLVGLELQLHVLYAFQILRTFFAALNLVLGLRLVLSLVLSRSCPVQHLKAQCYRAPFWCATSSTGTGKVGLGRIAMDISCGCHWASHDRRFHKWGLCRKVLRQSCRKVRLPWGSAAIYRKVQWSSSKKGCSSLFLGMKRSAHENMLPPSLAL